MTYHPHDVYIMTSDVVIPFRSGSNATVGGVVMRVVKKELTKVVIPFRSGSNATLLRVIGIISKQRLVS